MGNNSADELFSRRSNSRSADDLHFRPRNRTPSSTGYMMVVIAVAIVFGLFLWWLLSNSGDEAPWLPAGLAVAVVLLVALSAREVVMRRAWTRYLLENGIQEKPKSRSGVSQSGRSQRKGFSASLHSAALRTIQKASTNAETPGSTAEAHFEVARLCHDYLKSTEEAMRSGSLGSEKGVAIRAGQDRVKTLHKHHLLTWARGHSRALTREAQQRARTFDKIETANKASECIDSALRVYPNEPELHESRTAIQEFIASVKVAHWVELAERSAFKGHYRRAIDRYKDAMFYLNQDAVKPEVRRTGSERIKREIEKLQDALHSKATADQVSVDGQIVDED